MGYTRKVLEKPTPFSFAIMVERKMSAAKSELVSGFSRFLFTYVTLD